MSSSQLDRIVKGAIPDHLSPEMVATAARTSMTNSDKGSVTAPQLTTNDPISHLPSSPPQIYLNLLILEASLRAQYISLRARLRLHLLLLTALLAWSLGFTYLLFLRPREDGKGQGGSVYWMIETGEKLAFVSGAVTFGLVWASGMWNRSIRWPRRWLGTTNRGLRVFNLKIVILRRPWWRSVFDYVALLDPTGWLAGTKGKMMYQRLPRDVTRHAGSEKDTRRILSGTRRTTTWVDEDVYSGGDVVKLLLLPRAFSPEFREEWDSYRTAYWEKENERRAELRKYIKTRDRVMSAELNAQSRWWWPWRASKPKKPTPQTRTLREKPSSTQLRRDKTRDTLSRQGRRSRTSSPNVPPSPDPDGRPRTRNGGREGSRSRREGSSQPNGPAKRVSTTPSLPESAPASRSSTPTLTMQTRSSSEATTPPQRTPLAKRSSKLNMNSADEAIEEETGHDGS